jgi:hypothetical protein
LIFAGCTNDGVNLDSEVLEHFFKLPSQVLGIANEPAPEILETSTRQAQARLHESISERNAQFFETEAQRLDAWAEDLKISLERELKDIDRQIKEARRATSQSISLQEKLEGQKRIKQLEVTRSQKRRALFDAQDEIDAQRGKLIEELEQNLKQTAFLETIFTIRWRVK